MHSRGFRRWGSFILSACALALLAGASARLCNIPVFRYALERWSADPYGLIVTYSGELDPKEEKAVGLLEEYADGRANVMVEKIEDGKTAGGPILTVKFPDAPPDEPPLWTGPLSLENVKNILESPSRKEVSKRILAGDSAVWILLEIGDKEKDDAAAKVLEKHLKVMEKSLKLPELTEDPSDQLYFTEAVPLKLAFSVLRLKRNVPAERTMVQMLLQTEDDLAGLEEPMTFPAFGRGRILPALVGKGITTANIEDYCAFIAGACSCQVKALNPGMDLLISSEWVGKFGDVPDEPPPVELPPVILKPASEEPEENLSNVAVTPPVPPPAVPAPAPAPAPEPAKEPADPTSTTRMLLWAGVILAGILAVATGIRAMVLSRKENC